MSNLYEGNQMSYSSMAILPDSMTLVTGVITPSTIRGSFREFEVLKRLFDSFKLLKVRYSGHYQAFEHNEVQAVDFVYGLHSILSRLAYYKSPQDGTYKDFARNKMLIR